MGVPLRQVMVVPGIAFAVFTSAAVFWYGPSEPVHCGDPPDWLDHYGDIDGPGGTGYKGCLGPSTTNYVLTSFVFIGLLLAMAVVWMVAGLRATHTTGPGSSPVYLDADGNRSDPPNFR